MQKSAMARVSEKIVQGKPVKETENECRKVLQLQDDKTFLNFEPTIRNLMQG